MLVTGVFTDAVPSVFVRQVRRDDFLAVIKTIRRSITPEMIQFFEEWRDQSGGRSA